MYSILYDANNFLNTKKYAKQHTLSKDTRWANCIQFICIYSHVFCSHNFTLYSFCGEHLFPSGNWKGRVIGYVPKVKYVSAYMKANIVSLYYWYTF